MKSVLIALGAGALFGAGLVLAGMEQPAVILHAFKLSSAWDPRLPLLFFGANLVLVPVSAALRRYGKTLRGQPLQFVPRKPDPRLVVGSVIFGVGWGMGGICPGPAVTGALVGAPHVLAFLIAFTLGIVLHARLHSARVA